MDAFDESRPIGWRNNIVLHCALLMTFALLLNREATWVPGGNELIYFLYLYKAWHPAFLATDWTIRGEPTAGHAVFNALFGWPTLLMPLKWYGWIGRFVSWAVLFTALLRIGRQFKIPLWVASAAIFLWLIQRQSFVSNEWIIGTYEAKCVGYACLLFAIDTALRGKLVLPAILTGLAFSFHSAVGMWGGAAVFIAFAFQNPIRRTAKFAAIAAIFALPGVITSYKLVAGGHAITPDQAKFLVTKEMPFHLDSTVFGGAKIAVMYLMLLFNWLHYRRNAGDRKLKFLITLQIAAGAFFAMGIVWRRLGMFTLVELFPFRVFAVLIMLMFFWHLAAAYLHRAQRPIGCVATAIGIFTFLALPSPVMRLQTLATYNYPRWREPSDDLRVCFEWVRDHTPKDQIVIAPPWRKDAFYFTEHPLIACWHAPRFNAMTQWRERIEALCGKENVDNLDIKENLAGEMDDAAQDYYQHLSPRQIEQIRQKYGGNLLITTDTYNYGQIFSTPDGTYRVYRLGP